MTKHISVEADQFATTLDGLLGEIRHVSEEALFKGIHDGCELGRDEVRQSASAQGWKKYPSSWTYRTIRSKGGTEGHIYSTTPGLPHLLEKGHAKIGGGRTVAKPHILEPAHDAFDYTRKRVLDYIMRGLT